MFFSCTVDQNPSTLQQTESFSLLAVPQSVNLQISVVIMVIVIFLVIIIAATVIKQALAVQVENNSVKCFGPGDEGVCVTEH